MGNMQDARRIFRESQIMIKKNSKFIKCLNEQQFKTDFIKEQKKEYPDHKYFCIETEETVKGFPDVMETVKDDAEDCNIAFFYEFKISDSDGRIKFQPTQPSFYRKNPELNIQVFALHKGTDRVHVFNAAELFDKNSPYFMNEYARVDLTKAEEEDESTDCEP